MFGGDLPHKTISRPIGEKISDLRESIPCLAGNLQYVPRLRWQQDTSGTHHTDPFVGATGFDEVSIGIGCRPSKVTPNSLNYAWHN